MGIGVAEMLERIDSRELAEWMALYSIDPWGEQRADLRSAIVASAAANAYPRKGRPTKPEDFMPFRDTQHDAKRATATLKATFQRAAALFNRRHQAKDRGAG